MSRLIRPVPYARSGLSDARSTGTPPPNRVRDILALKGTKRD